MLISDWTIGTTVISDWKLGRMVIIASMLGTMLITDLDIRYNGHQRVGVGINGDQLFPF